MVSTYRRFRQPHAANGSLPNIHSCQLHRWQSRYAADRWQGLHGFVEPIRNAGYGVRFGVDLFVGLAFRGSADARAGESRFRRPPDAVESEYGGRRSPDHAELPRVWDRLQLQSGEQQMAF